MSYFQEDTTPITFSLDNVILVFHEHNSDDKMYAFFQSSQQQCMVVDDYPVADLQETSKSKHSLRESWWDIGFAGNWWCKKQGNKKGKCNSLIFIAHL